MSSIPEFQEFFNELDNLKSEINKLESEYWEKSFNNFSNVLKYANRKYPKVFSVFYWNQHTPYFNDGEPCEFGVGDLYFNSLLDECVKNLLGDTRAYTLDAEEASKIISVADVEFSKINTDEIDAWDHGGDTMTLVGKISRGKNESEVSKIHKTIQSAFIHAQNGFLGKFGDPAFVIVEFDANNDSELIITTKDFEHD